MQRIWWLELGTVPEAIDDIFVDLKRERDLEPSSNGYYRNIYFHLYSVSPSKTSTKNFQEKQRKESYLAVLPLHVNRETFARG